MMDPEQQAKRTGKAAAPVGEQTQIDHLFEHSADAVVILADNRFVGANNAAVRLFGYRRQDEFLALHPAQISPEFQPDGSPSLEKADHMLQVAIQKGVNRFEWVHQRADGQVFPVEVMLTPYPYGDGMRVYAVIRDISDRKAAEAALQAEKDFTSAILRNLPGSFFLLNAQGQMVRWNENYELLSGWSEADLRQRSPLEALEPEDRARAGAVIQTVMTTGRGELEARILTAKGESIPFLFSGVRLEIGGEIYLLGLGADIRERKRLEDEQRQLAHVIESSPDVIGVATPDGRALYLNPAGLALLGYSSEDFAAGGLSIQVLEPDLPEEVFPTVIETGTWAGETLLTCKDGRKIPVSQVVTASKDAQGNLVSVATIARDIRERKQAEAEAQAEKALTDAILNSLPNAFYMFDTSGRLTRWNERYQAAIGFNQAETSQRNALDAIAEEDRPQVGEAIGKVLAEGEAAVEASLLNRQGEKRPYLFTGRRMQVDDALYVLGMGVDISDQKQAQDVVRASQQRLAALAANLPGVVFIVDADGVFRLSEGRGLAGLGLQPGQVVGLSAYEVYKDVPQIGEDIRRCLETGQESVTTVAVGPFVFETRYAPLPEVDGKPGGVLGVSIDIAERLKAQQEIQASQQQLAELAANIPGVVFVVDADGVFRLSEGRGLAGLGLQPGQVVGQSAYEVYKDVPQISDDIRRCLETGQESVTQVTVGPFVFETRYTPLPEVDGKPGGVLGISIDIAERLKAQQEIQASQQQLAELAANIPGVVFVIDADGVFLLSEGRGLAGLGLQPGQVVGQSAYDVYKDVPQISDDIRRCLETGQESVTQVTVGPFVFETRYTPLAGTGGKPGGVLGISIDIADRLKAQQEILASQQQLAALAANLPGSVFILDKDGIFQLSEGRALPDLGLRPGQVVGQSVFEVYKDLPSVADEVRRALAGDDDFVALAQVGNLYFETRYASLRDAEGNPNGTLGVALNVTERIQLEQQVQTALERRGYQVQVSTQIAQEIAAAPDLQTLFERVVTLVKERFGYYHAQILRYDPARQAVMLAAGYGETGQKMLEASHRLPMGVGLIGTAAAAGQTTLRSALKDDPEWQPNPLLPDTQGEIAVPIKLRSQVLGVLDVQSAQANVLGEDDRLLLEGLCGQIAIAIEDTRLRQEMEERLNELNRLTRAASREGWQAYRQGAGRAVDYFFDQMDVHPGHERWQRETQLAMDCNQVVRSEQDLQALALPLALRGEVIGALALEDDPQQPLSAQDLALVEAIGEQVALALESARLFEQTQTALGETQTLYDIIARMNAADSYPDILAALSEPTILQDAQPLLLMAVFDQPLGGGRRPEWIFPVAHRSNSGIDIAERYPLNAFEAIPGTLFTDRPVAMSNLASDQRLDRVTRTLFQDIFQAQSSVVIPLMLGNQVIGFVQGYFEETAAFPEAELDRLMAVAGQAAIAVQSRLLLEQAQSRARQEQRIREVTSQVFGASDVDTIMRRAVEQVGHVLGLPAYIYLGQPGEETDRAAGEPES